MRKYKVIVEGVAPLRMNRFTDEAKDTLEGGRKKKAKDDKVREAYERTYKDAKGNYIVPGKAIKAAILNGAKKVPLGKGKAKADSKAVLFVDDKGVKLIHAKPVVTEEVVRIPPKTGALAVKYFVTFPEWKCEFELLVTDDRFPEPVIEESIREAGMYAGFLDGRPDYGRFVLSEFKQRE